MVVVGDQSAGKSSVLDSLTGFHFPRNVTLCTRHATEIICRREETESIVVSIQAVDADEEKAKTFRRQATNLDAPEFEKIFSDVRPNLLMVPSMYLTLNRQPKSWGSSPTLGVAVLLSAEISFVLRSVAQTWTTSP